MQVGQKSSDVIIDHGGLHRAGFQVLQGPFPGEDEAGVDAGVDAAGDVRIQPVADHHSLLRLVAVAGHGQLCHFRLGLADEDGLAPGGLFQHPADTAAVGDITVPGGAHPVGIGGDEVDPPVEKNTAVLQFLEVQLCIVAVDQDFNALLQVGGDPDAGFYKLLAEGLGAGGVDELPGVVVLEVQNGGIHTGEKVLHRTLNAQPGQLFHIGFGTFRGIIGQKQVFSADFFHIL